MSFTTVLHLGHLGELAGHDHWIGLAAVGIALGAAALGALAGKTDDEEDAPEDHEEAGA